jgi:hypothetical protein
MKQRNKKKQLQKHLATAANKILKQMVDGHTSSRVFLFAWKDAFGYTPKEAALLSFGKSDTYKIKMLHATKFFKYCNQGFSSDGYFYDVKLAAIVLLWKSMGNIVNEEQVKRMEHRYQELLKKKFMST